MKASGISNGAAQVRRKYARQRRQVRAAAVRSSGSYRNTKPRRGDLMQLGSTFPYGQYLSRDLALFAVKLQMKTISEQLLHHQLAPGRVRDAGRGNCIDVIALRLHPPIRGTDLVILNAVRCTNQALQRGVDRTESSWVGPEVLTADIAGVRETNGCGVKGRRLRQNLGGATGTRQDLPQRAPRPSIAGCRKCFEESAPLT